MKALAKSLNMTLLAGSKVVKGVHPDGSQHRLIRLRERRNVIQGRSIYGKWITFPRGSQFETVL